MVITGYAVLFDQPDRAGCYFSRKVKLGGIIQVPVCVDHHHDLPAIGKAFLKKTRYGIKYRAFITDPEYAEILKKYMHMYVFSIYANNIKVDRDVKVTYLNYDIREISIVAERFSMWDRDKLRIKVQ